MKAPNGFGGITKLSGKRRRPYWCRITAGWEINEVTGKAKQIYKTLGYYATRKDAMLALAEYHQNPIDLMKKDITFAEVWDIWSIKHFEKHPSSERGLRAGYGKCTPLHTMAVKDIRTTHLQSILDSMKGMSLSSQTKVKTVMNFTFKYCMENDIITKDYSQFVTVSGASIPDSSNKYFELNDIKRILNADDELAYSLTLLLYTGMRIGELLNQKVEDIDLENRIIRVRGTKTESADRLVPIHKDIIPIIEKRMHGAYLVPNQSGNKLTYTNYKRTFYDAFKTKMGFEQTPHAFRHTFISLMDKCGVESNSVVLKRIVGHANGSVTDLYTHKNAKDLIEAIDKLKIF